MTTNDFVAIWQFSQLERRFALKRRRKGVIGRCTLFAARTIAGDSLRNRSESSESGKCEKGIGGEHAETRQGKRNPALGFRNGA